MAATRKKLGFVYQRYANDMRRVEFDYEGERYGMRFWTVCDLGWQMETQGFDFDFIADMEAKVRDCMLEDFAGRDAPHGEDGARQWSPNGWARPVFVYRWFVTLAAVVGYLVALGWVGYFVWRQL